MFISDASVYSDESVEMASKGEVDLALWTETNEKGENLIKLPCYNDLEASSFQKHPLTLIPKIKLKDLAQFPIVTYLDLLEAMIWIEPFLREGSKQMLFLQLLMLMSLKPM